MLLVFFRHRFLLFLLNIVAHPDILSKVKTKTQWSNVSYLSVGAAIAALDHEDFKTVRDTLCKRREDFLLFLSQRNFLVFPSKINAVLIRFNSEKEGIKFAHYLHDHDIIISHGNGNSNVGLDESFVRISIGNEEEMTHLKKLLEYAP